jgi:hypothetical protein
MTETGIQQAYSIHPFYGHVTTILCGPRKLKTEKLADDDDRRCQKMDRVKKTGRALVWLKPCKCVMPAGQRGNADVAHVFQVKLAVDLPGTGPGTPELACPQLVVRQTGLQEHTARTIIHR